MTEPTAPSQPRPAPDARWAAAIKHLGAAIAIDIIRRAREGTLHEIEDGPAPPRRTVRRSTVP